MPEEDLNADPDARARASSRRLVDDDDYHEYLWGERSPRSFALKAKLGTKKREPRSVIQVQTDATFDASEFVPR